jgi:hypothetical protein
MYLKMSLGRNTRILGIGKSNMGEEKSEQDQSIKLRPKTPRTSQEA